MAAQGAFGTDFYDRSTRTILATMLWTEYVLKIGPKGALMGSHEIRPIHSALSLGPSIATAFPIFFLATFYKCYLLVCFCLFKRNGTVIGFWSKVVGIAALIGIVIDWCRFLLIRMGWHEGRTHLEPDHEVSSLMCRKRKPGPIMSPIHWN